MTTKKVTVVIPVKNGEKTLKNCLVSLMNQDISQYLDFKVIDSGSNDGTKEILKLFPFVEVVDIDPSNFNHGKTRREALENIYTEFVFFTVQDSEAASNDVLSKMLEHMKDNNVAGVCGKQVVKKDKRYNPLAWHNPISSPTFRKLYVDGKEDRKNFLFENSHWDNVCALYRTGVLKNLPFRDCIFGEDRLWAKEALEAGFSLVSDDRCLFYHYHHESFQDRFKRALLVYHFELKNFNKIRNEKYSFYSVFILPLLKVLKHNHHIKWAFYNMKLEYASMKAYSMSKKISTESNIDLDDYENNLIAKGIPIGKIN